jgi:two-component system, sensor histidine kinase and response regulator
MATETICVLLIEDNDAEAFLLQEMLFGVSSAQPFDLVRAKRLEEGLRCLAEDAYDVVLLDLLLPDSAGLSTFSQVYDKAPDDMPIIVLSGLDDRNLAIEAVRLGAQDYLVKTDVDGNLLVRSIRYAIERKQTEQAMRERAVELQLRNRELDAFSHTVAHDLRSPLTVILGYAELIEESYETIESDMLLTYVQGIMKQGQKANAIIQELLLLSSVRKSDVKVEALDMLKVVEGAIERLKYPIEDSRPKITIPETLPTALGHAMWVEEVWFNYISNALKYCDPSPEISIGGERNGDDQVRYWVRDNGPGISEPDQASLFVPFTQISQVKSDGYGLGLSIVRRIIEKLSGHVGVESEPGSGSTFYFVLPAADQDVVLTE